jgi:arylsulfatase A-like enzyme
MRFFAMRVLYGAIVGLSLGALAGAGELLYLTWFQLKLLMTPAQWSALFAMAVATYGLLGAGVGGATALALAPLLGRGAKVQYYRSVMKRDLLAPALTPVVGVVLAVLSLILVSPWVLVALRADGGLVWGLLVSGFVVVMSATWALAFHRILRRRDEGHPAVFPMWLPIPVLVMVLFVVGVVRSPAGGKGFGSHVNEALPNLVLVTLDTFRADHLSFLGNRAVSTPTLDYFARKNVYFPNAVCPLPETAPSHASMLTGLHPLDHGVLDNASPLPSSAETLAEFLHGHGYSTAAFVSAYSLDRELRLDQGFDVYDDDFTRRVRGYNDLALRQLTIWLRFRFGQPAKMTELERPAEYTNARAAEWLSRHYSENFFLWMHYFEPHAPYVPHGLEGFEVNGKPGAPSVDHVAILDERRNSYSPDEVVKLRALYAEECSHLDRRIGDFFLLLEDYEVYDNSVIIVLADHGESLGEHEVLFSHMGLYDPSIRVPFMLRAPALGDEHVVVEDQVRVQDVFPTALSLLGFRYAATMDGRDLQPRIRQQESGDLQALLTGRMGHLGTGMHVGLRERSWKYLRTPPPESTEEYYRLLEDPDELHDVSGEETQAVQAVRSAVNAVIGGTSVGEPAGTGDLDPEQCERLRMLGYVEDCP